MSTIRDITLDKNSIKNQLGENPDKFNLPINFKSDIGVKVKSTEVQFIDIEDSFILGSTTNAILGTSQLGDRRAVHERYVFPLNDIVEEDFLDYKFLNQTNTTATLNLDGSVDFSDGDILESETVAKIKNNIKNINFNKINKTGEGILQIEFSVDGGLTWNSIAENTKTTLTGGSVDDDLKYKITSTGSCTLNAPLIIQINK